MKEIALRVEFWNNKYEWKQKNYIRKLWYLNGKMHKANAIIYC